MTKTPRLLKAQKKHIPKTRKSKKNKKVIKRPKAKIIKKTKKIKKVKKIKTRTKTQQKKINEKRKERLQKNDHNLYQQMLKMQERVERMDRDKELYYLIDLKKDKGIYTFTVMKKNDPKKIKIRIHSDSETNCSCMDWRTRCKNLGIACKHIYYLLHKMLNYELYEYFDNRINKMENFKDLVKRRVRLNEDFTVKDKKNLNREICPICFLNFEKFKKKDIKKCPDCSILVHKECVSVWLKHSLRRNCVICKSESWNLAYFH